MLRLFIAWLLRCGSCTRFGHPWPGLAGTGLREISQQRQISETERFRTKIQSVFRNTYCTVHVWEYIFYDKASQSENRNRMADGTLDDSLRLAPRTLVVISSVSEKP